MRRQPAAEPFCRVATGRVARSLAAPSPACMGNWVAAAALCLMAAPVTATHISIDFDHAVKMEDDHVVIAVEGDREARISPDGDLTIEGRRVKVAPRDRDDLIRYNVTMHWLEERAVELGVQGAGLAFSAIGEAIAAIATGDEDGAERRVEQRAERLKDGARELCIAMRRLERLQDGLASRIAAFRPYAVIELDADDCRVE
jgi:hypothetical protein